jgi:Flp pilus assembly pilin Flp
MNTMINKMNNVIKQKFQQLKSFVEDESGQGISEYGGVLAAVSVLIAVLVTFISSGYKNDVHNEFSNAQQATRNLVKQGTSKMTAAGMVHLDSASAL